MKPTFTGIKKQTDNPFLNMYAMDAVDTGGRHFGYYFATRKSEEELVCRTGVTKPDGAVIYAILKDEPDKIVLIRQYRYPLGKYLYEVPAGLIDGDETPQEAAVREMHEETGLEFEAYNGGADAFRRAFYQAQGLCDESNAFVFGYAKGNVSDEAREASEDIQVIIADKAEAMRILEEEEVSIRCACMLMMFVNSDSDKPFAFLG
ncbi:MAG: NUDIX hydrolase [Bacteroides sp.]